MEPRARSISRSPGPPWPEHPPLEASTGSELLPGPAQERPGASKGPPTSAQERPKGCLRCPQTRPRCSKALSRRFKTLPKRLKRPEGVSLYIFCGKMQVNGSPKYIKNQSRSHHCETASVLQKVSFFNRRLVFKVRKYTKDNQQHASKGCFIWH